MSIINYISTYEESLIHIHKHAHIIMQQSTTRCLDNTSTNYV